MDGNYIKIDRKILDWEWYKNINTCRLFFHMLLIANWKEAKFEGTTVPRGSFIRSIRKLSEETGLTEKEIRTAIKHLESTGEVASKGHNKYTVFTINNYDKYQIKGEQRANKRQTNGEQRATIEERKKERKEEYNNTSCSERKDSPSLADVEAIPLNDGTEWNCPIDVYNECVRLYPAVDVRQAFRDMRAWCLSNMEKRKTRRGVKRFVNSWLSKEQDKSKSRPKEQGKPNKFHNFQGREYQNMTEMTKKLIEM